MIAGETAARCYRRARTIAIFKLPDDRVLGSSSLSGAQAKSPHAPRTPAKKGGRGAAAGGGGGTKKLAAATSVASGEALQRREPGKETGLADQGIGASGGEARREARTG